MFHGFKKTKGVISIFLVIILVPMLTARCYISPDRGRVVEFYNANRMNI